MARETKTIQCYPDCNTINQKIKIYEAFGWEVIGSQRYQEYLGQTKSYNYLNKTSTVTRHYSSINVLTITRDKKASWYDDVVQLERRYDEIMATRPTEPSRSKSPIEAIVTLICLFVGIICTLFGALFDLTVLLAIGVVFMVFGILLAITYFINKYGAKSKKIKWEYCMLVDKWDNEHMPEVEKILAQAENIVNA